MASIELTTLIEAPCGVCFNLARSVDVHQQSTSQTKERAVAGRTSGLCESGDQITWEAIHFGIRQQLTVKITRMEFPHLFEDEMVKGAFLFMKHIHRFESTAEGTLMTDFFTYGVPFGFLGKLFDKLVLERYMTRFLKQRNEVLKRLAESQK